MFSKVFNPKLKKEKDKSNRFTSLPIQDNTPLELVTLDHKRIIIEYNSETKQLVIKAGANTLKSRLVN